MVLVDELNSNTALQLVIFAAKVKDSFKVIISCASKIGVDVSDQTFAVLKNCFDCDHVFNLR